MNKQRVMWNLLLLAIIVLGYKYTDYNSWFLLVIMMDFKND